MLINFCVIHHFLDLSLYFGLRLDGELYCLKISRSLLQLTLAKVVPQLGSEIPLVFIVCKMSFYLLSSGSSFAVTERIRKKKEILN